MQGQAGGVAVGPGDEGGVAADVVGEGGLSSLALRQQQQAGVERVLGDIDADEGGGGLLAHGVPPLWLMDAGSAFEGPPREKSEVEGPPWLPCDLVPEVRASVAASGSNPGPTGLALTQRAA